MGQIAQLRLPASFSNVQKEQVQDDPWRVQLGAWEPNVLCSGGSFGMKDDDWWIKSGDSVDKLGEGEGEESKWTGFVVYGKYHCCKCEGCKASRTVTWIPNPPFLTRDKTLVSLSSISKVCSYGMRRSALIIATCCSYKGGKEEVRHFGTCEIIKIQQKVSWPCWVLGDTCMRLLQTHPYTRLAVQKLLAAACRSS